MLHFLITVENKQPRIESIHSDWLSAYDAWKALDDRRIKSGVSQQTLYYAVREMNDSINLTRRAFQSEDMLRDLLAIALSYGQRCSALIRDDDGWGTEVVHSVKSVGPTCATMHWTKDLDRVRGLSEIDRLYICGRLAWQRASA